MRQLVYNILHYPLHIPVSCTPQQEILSKSFNFLMMCAVCINRFCVICDSINEEEREFCNEVRLALK